MNSDIEKMCRIVDQTVIPHKAYEKAKERLDDCFRNSGNGNPPICFAILGESRCGKSAVVQEFIDEHPQQRTESGLFVPVLKVLAHHEPTPKNIAEDMLDALGDPIVKKYNVTGHALTSQLRTLLKSARTKMIVIDEFQHFQEKDSNKVMYKAADWLKNLIESTQVSLVVSGLPNTTEVIESNSQLKNRFSGQVILPRFDWSVEDERDEFRWILSCFYEVLKEHIDLPELHEPLVAFRFYVATGGAIGLIAKILREDVRHACETRRSKTTLSDYARAFEVSNWNGHKNNPFQPSLSLQPNPQTLAIAKAMHAQPQVEVRNLHKRMQSQAL